LIDINDTFTLISTTVAIGGGLWGLYSGLKEYKNSQGLRSQELKEQQRELALKRQEIIFPLIKEFDEKETLYYAKQIIDGVPVEAEPKKGAAKKTFTYADLDHLYANPPFSDDELFIRIIIDHFLNFFGKIGYLLDNEIITKKEISYFLYYIERAIRNEAIKVYARMHDYELFGVFLDKIGMLPDDFQPLVQNYYRRQK
jgi:hypothetical protein